MLSSKLKYFRLTFIDEESLLNPKLFYEENYAKEDSTMSFIVIIEIKLAW